MTIMNNKCFQIEVFLCLSAPEFSVKLLVLFNTMLYIYIYIYMLQSDCEISQFVK